VDVDESVKKGMYSGTLINDLFGLVDRKNVDRKNAERAEAERSRDEGASAEPAHVDSRSPGAKWPSQTLSPRLRQ